MLTSFHVKGLCAILVFMLPVYCLSILLNSLAGLILVCGTEEAEEGSLVLSFNNGTLRIVIGIVSLVTGFLKILSPVAGNVPVLGDLVPAFTGIAVGFILVFETSRRRSPDSGIADVMERLAALLGRNRKTFGFVCMGAALVHLVFYPIIFL